MKKKELRIVLAGVLVLGLSGTAQATLFDRGGGMIYDSGQDLTWLQDANYAMTNGDDADGKMNWSTATGWATGLSHGGYEDWRLPTIVDMGASGCPTPGYSGTDCGFNVNTSGSELAYMFHDILGNESLYNPDTTRNSTGCPNGCVQNTSADGVGVFNLQSQINLQSQVFWTGTEYAPDDTNLAWVFNVYSGFQGYGPKSAELYAWAVRSGDVAPVPLPAAVWLFGAGLAGLGVFGRIKG